MTDLSVVIPTRNRADLLPAALESILRQEVEPDRYEVIVVDNGSTDGTAAAAKSFASRIRNFKYVYDDKPGLHVGRHCGLKAAAGDVIVYVDDDIEASPGWLAALHECFADQATVLAGGNNIPMFLAPPPHWLALLWNRYSAYDGGKAMAALSILELPEGRRDINPHYIWGCNFAVRKSFLEDVGGFRPDGMPKSMLAFRGDGETHVAREATRRGKRAVFDANASVRHKVTPDRMTIEYFGSRAFSQGISDSFSHIKSGGTAFRQTARRLKSSLRLARDYARFSHSVELQSVTTLQHQEYWKGFAFHQNSYRTLPEVRAWLERSSYID